VIQLVFTIASVASGRSLSAVIVIGVIFTVLMDALNNPVGKNNRKRLNVTSTAIKGVDYMLSDSSDIASGKKKK
jgi:hypothetical protein